MRERYWLVYSPTHEETPSDARQYVCEHAEDAARWHAAALHVVGVDAQPGDEFRTQLVTRSAWQEVTLS